MKKELIAELFNKFESACYIYKNVECWSARELQEILNYSKWENFFNVIDKSKNACLNAGEAVPDHFADIRKMVDLGSGAKREIEDIALTRYACYLIAQNGDPAKNEVAFDEDKMSEPGFMGLNDYQDFDKKKSYKSLNHNNHSSDNKSIIELVNNG